MADVNVVAVLTAKAGSGAEVRQALDDLVASTRHEEGCLAYDLYESTAAPGTFVTIEHWRDQADLEAHMQTEHVRQALVAAGDHLDGAPAIHPLQPVNAGG